VAPLIGGRTFTGKNGKHYIQIQAHIPVGTPLSTTGSDYIISIDTSGSMDTVAWVKVEEGKAGITRLSLVKHLVKTIVAMLGPTDRVALLSFNSEARPILGLTPMTDPGKSDLIRVLDRLAADGSTHLYGGVEEAARIASSDTCRGRRIVGMILTDGQPTESIHPVTGGRSTLSVIKERIRVANPWTFHAIGFSSDVNCSLLAQLAALWNGRMLFVPSGDMVSTNGINLAAFEKTVVSLGTTVEYTVNEVPHTLALGPLGVGQRKDFVMEVQPEAPRLSIRGDSHHDIGSIEFADCRQDFVDTLTKIIERIAIYYGSMDGLPSLLIRQLMDFYERHVATSDGGVKALLRDVVPGMEGEGQCRLALGYLEPGNWGLPYLRAYRDHMRDSVCMNFKDPGLKLFETPAFLEFQRQGDAAFAAISPPQIYRQGATAAAAPVDMSAFNNASGGCFEGSMPVRMASITDGFKAIRDLRRGDRVWTPSGTATVQYAIEINTKAPSQPMVQLTPRIAVTPWHPCKLVHDTTWSFPADRVQFAARPLQTVYNLVLDQGHVIESIGFGTMVYQFVTLGHGFQEAPLGHGFQEAPLQHAFFGSRERIMASLERQPGFEEGRPVYSNLVAVKEEGLIVDWTVV
jgi:hypothetical protein